MVTRARTSTSNRKGRDIRQLDTSASVTSFVGTSGPLWMRGRDRTRTLNTPVEGELQAPPEPSRRGSVAPPVCRPSPCFTVVEELLPFVGRRRTCSGDALFPDDFIPGECVSVTSVRLGNPGAGLPAPSRRVRQGRGVTFRALVPGGSNPVLGRHPAPGVVPRAQAPRTHLRAAAGAESGPRGRPGGKPWVRTSLESPRKGTHHANPATAPCAPTVGNPGAQARKSEKKTGADVPARVPDCDWCCGGRPVNGGTGGGKKTAPPTSPSPPVREKFPVYLSPFLAAERRAGGGPSFMPPRRGELCLRPQSTLLKGGPGCAPQASRTGPSPVCRTHPLGPRHGVGQV
ncbi:hypothetical protein HPB47_002552 [Ixodes persulcatus]|uniref:Uncharacterized protein n=1 Tax=Ixodes persulcatus TaxID=34615 RepID=A0AC60PMP0_IXOPE|nr:hypothetical protein HPB47_002552 [Ixodes persulcatus]